MSKYSYITNLRAIEEHVKRAEPGELYVFAKGKRVDNIVSQAARHGIEVQKREKHEYNHLFGFLETEKTLPLVLKIQEESQLISSLDSFLESIKNEREPICILILDQVKDPQNLGNIIRTCDQLAIDLVVMPEKHNVKITDAVKNTSVGAYKFVKTVFYQNVSSMIKKLKEHGFWIYSSDIEGESIVSTNFANRTCLVLGSEGEGIRGIIKEESDETITIPSLGKIESYNLSSAAAIMLYEVRKKQGTIK